jgi:uncharacterized membrane protein
MNFARPSFLAFNLQGILLAIIVLLFIQNYKSLSKKDLMLGLLLFSIAVGVHSILHHIEEQTYGFNPLKILM